MDEKVFEKELIELRRLMKWEVERFKTSKLVSNLIKVSIFPIGEGIENAYPFYEESGGELAFQIVFLIREKSSMNYDKFRFMLYHELGHVIQMITCYRLDGLTAVDGLIKSWRTEVELLEDWVKNGLINRETEHKWYRLISIEKEADEFAVLMWNEYLEERGY